MSKCIECIHGVQRDDMVWCTRMDFDDIPIENDSVCCWFEQKSHAKDDSTPKPEVRVKTSDPVNSPSHYIGKIECVDYLRDKLTQEEFTGFCMGNVLKYSSRWRKKDGLQDLKKAKVYLEWAIENEEKNNDDK